MASRDWTRIAAAIVVMLVGCGDDDTAATTAASTGSSSGGSSTTDPTTTSDDTGPGSFPMCDPPDQSLAASFELNPRPDPGVLPLACRVDEISIIGSATAINLLCPNDKMLDIPYSLSLTLAPAMGLAVQAGDDVEVRFEPGIDGFGMDNGGSVALLDSSGDPIVAISRSGPDFLAQNGSPVTFELVDGLCAVAVEGDNCTSAERIAVQADYQGQTSRLLDGQADQLGTNPTYLISVVSAVRVELLQCVDISPVDRFRILLARQ